MFGTVQPKPSASIRSALWVSAPCNVCSCVIRYRSAHLKQCRWIQLFHASLFASSSQDGIDQQLIYTIAAWPPFSRSYFLCIVLCRLNKCKRCFSLLGTLQSITNHLSQYFATVEKRAAGSLDIASHKPQRL